MPVNLIVYAHSMIAIILLLDQTPSKIPEISFIKLVYRLITINPIIQQKISDILIF
jgi:hypothetical protein